MNERPRQRDENPAGIDLPPDPLPGHSSRGRLERVPRRGEFAVTTELNPPDSADPEDVYNRARIRCRRHHVDASGANCHMSSVGICALLTRMGYAPIMQIACRDKNRHRDPGRCAGCSGHGRGQHALPDRRRRASRRPACAKPVFTSIHVAAGNHPHHARQCKFLSGRKLTTPPQLFLGAAAQSLRTTLRLPPRPFGKKIAAGAQFVQTQYGFDVPMFRTFMQRAQPG